MAKERNNDPIYPFMSQIDTRLFFQPKKKKKGWMGIALQYLKSMLLKLTCDPYCVFMHGDNHTLIMVKAV